MAEESKQSKGKNWFLTGVIVVLIAIVGVQSYLLYQKKKTDLPEFIAKHLESNEKPPHYTSKPRNPFHERDFFTEMRQLQHRIDRMFDQHFTQGFDANFPVSSGEIGFFDFDVDLRETHDSFILSCDIPGLDKKQINVHLDGNVLIIEGTRSKEQEAEQNGWISRERHFGSFSRSIALPAPVDASSVKAEYKNGVLQITVKKLKVDSTEKTRIQVI